ncbi:hypothetical protein FQN51_008030 [Onygenales sp. PD_10]|nr:hypothetical protein FQN51_008030 [Onygenales sp. PD_10]
MTSQQEVTSTTRQANPTCWDMWLKHKAEFCPFLPDLTAISSEIKFLQRLSDGGHSYIVKVSLQGRIYALKIFTLIPAQWSRPKFERHALEHDPFILECRVYDLVTEGEKLGKVGPYCFGWLTITRDQEEELARNLRYPFDWCRIESTENDPVRCLLLEYIDGCQIDKGYLTVEGADSLREQLEYLHSLNIAHGDLFPRNIMVSKDGRALLIDFSNAIPWPVSKFAVRKKEDFEEYLSYERGALELLLYRLQKLKRHQGLLFSKANSDEEAYGRPFIDWIDRNYQVSDD